MTIAENIAKNMVLLPNLCFCICVDDAIDMETGTSYGYSNTLYQDVVGTSLNILNIKLKSKFLKQNMGELCISETDRFNPDTGYTGTQSKGFLLPDNSNYLRRITCSPTTFKLKMPGNGQLHANHPWAAILEDRRHFKEDKA
jgi:hypothetical protein